MGKARFEPRSAAFGTDALPLGHRELLLLERETGWLPSDGLCVLPLAIRLLFVTLTRACRPQKARKNRESKASNKNEENERENEDEGEEEENEEEEEEEEGGGGGGEEEKKKKKEEEEEQQQQ